MKNYIKTLLCLVIFAVAGCDKEAEIVPDTDLFGTWELRHVLGIQIAGTSPDFPAGNGNLVKFDGDKYEIFIAMAT